MPVLQQDFVPTTWIKDCNAGCSSSGPNTRWDPTSGPPFIRVTCFPHFHAVQMEDTTLSSIEMDQTTLRPETRHGEKKQFPPMQGRFIWYELMTTDTDAATDFYRGVIGWETQDSGVVGMDYTMFTVAGRPVSGTMELPQTARSMGMPPQWLGYIAVDDVDTLAADIVIAGGVVHRAAADIPGIGRFAIVGDPDGATFALFQADGGDPPPEAPMGTPGHIGWRELYAENAEGAFAFYRQAFGWQLHREMDMKDGGVYRIFGLDGQDLGGIMTRPPSMRYPLWTFYFNVDAIDAASERVRAAGGQVVFGPMEVPGNIWIVQCVDPQGALFALTAARR